MSAHTRIDAATKAIATAKQDAQWRGGDVSHEAAVELEARKLLSESRAQLEREIRAERAAVIQQAIDAHQAADPHAYFQFRAGMREALRIVLGACDTDGSPGDLLDPSEHRRPERFPGERNARRMLRESAVSADLPDVADPAGDS